MLEGTYRQRVQFITSQLEKDISVLDIGCGEFTYYKKMMAQDFAASYYAVDTNSDFERLAQTISRRYEGDNLIFLHSLEAFDSDESVNILLTEVIEHNPLEEAKELIKKALALNFNKLIITTPNVTFNQFYSMEKELRHDDHHFELTEQAFEELIEDCIRDKADSKKYKTQFFRLGDSLNDIQPTLGCIITKE